MYRSSLYDHFNLFPPHISFQQLHTSYIHSDMSEYAWHGPLLQFKKKKTTNTQQLKISLIVTPGILPRTAGNTAYLKYTTSFR